jgi:hypothetical protein
MANVKIKWENAGFQGIMKSGEMQSILQTEAAARAAWCGDGFTSRVKVGEKRAFAYVEAESFPARVRNNRDNTLLKSIGL